MKFRKRVISIIAIIMAILMALSLVASVLPSAFAISQSDIDALKKKKEEISARVAEAEAYVNTLKDEQANVLDQKAALEEKNDAAKEALAIVAEEILMYDGIIEEKTEELNEALNREAVQLDKYRVRVRAMEESGGYNILSVLMSSGDFNEFLTALDDMEKIMTSDRDLEDLYIAAREESERVKAEYEAVKTECEEKQDGLRAEQAGIEKQIEETEKDLAELEDQLEAAVAEYEEWQSAEEQAAQEVLNMIAAYERQKEEEAAARAAAQAAAAAAAAQQAGSAEGGESSGGLNPGAASGTGSFIWPVPCSTRITSRFGYRTDPFTGEQRYHSGIDIDGYGNEGGAIIAADGGTVVTATYNDGYGNYIIIDHGNGYQTLYGHMSGLAVGSGATVSQGQTIGYLGATGRATGTHCHFEVFINGSRTDPAGFFSGLSYYNC
ncbi:MAG: peptidoglycan DD-metalloendopeptidase family protein [Oscillospiraceae bacterium]|nr:peptidoglycan DD-metalloendopeptidase family protein [Oscillospiraceae bacterium]